MSKKIYYSQVGQDEFLDQKIFKEKKGGFFIEIGADNGITHSNTYFFEKFRNWHGICIEPRKKSFDELVKNRSAICENYCITNVNSAAKMNFLEISGYNEQLSGLIDKYDSRHLERIRRAIGEDALSKNIVQINCDNLNNIVAKHDIVHVDYCSIDTEGGELDILKSINFSTLAIDLISVENNFKTKEIQRFLKSKNYRKIKSVSFDDIYVKKNLSYYNYVYSFDYFKNTLIYIKMLAIKYVKKSIPQSLKNRLK